MNLNFKKNNLLIIMLLIFVILSCIVFINMSNIKESFTNVSNNNRRYFVDTASDSSYNYYKVNNGAYNYYFQNMSFDSNNVYSSLNLVKTVTKDSFKAGIAPSIKNYFLANNALIGYTKDNSYVQLYNVKPSIILDINAVIKSSSSPLDISGMYMLLLEHSGNLYDLSNNKLSTFNMKINNIDIIKSGLFQKIETTNTPTPSANNSISDINFSGLFGNSNGIRTISNELFLYLLNQGNFGSSYVPPIYNNFETAMNLPSNPIVNPVNSMNPVEYAETLFGPQVTPMMSKNSYLNSDIAISAAAASKEMSNISTHDTTTANANTNANANANKLNTNTSMKDIFKFDTDGNLLSQNIGNSSNNTKVNQDEKRIKENCAPCPAPQRCPESNFDCKKIPNYEQGINNAFLPRPVLADFSTFGT